MVMSHALQNRSVFKCVQNCVSVNAGSRTVSGSEFHRLGPETAKLDPLSVFRRTGTRNV